MRETLTVLAGFLVLALLAALIGPHFVDWRAHRASFEARLADTLGVETRIGGEIGLRLLPSPRLTLGDVALGRAGEASSVRAETLVVELALAPLARGAFHVTEAAAEGAELTLVGDEEGTSVLPPLAAGRVPASASLERLTLRRSALVRRENGRETLRVAPISAEMSAVSLLGPWRADGEAAGTSFRVATGALESDGRLRSKASLVSEDIHLSFDGSVQLGVAGGVVAPRVEGAFSLTPGGAVTLAGRVAGTPRQLDVTGLTLDLAGGAARLEGEGQVLPRAAAASLVLRARRLDGDALAAALDERPGALRALQTLPGTADLTLDLDQLLWRGEDWSGFALRGRLGRGGLDGATASARIAGALIGAEGAISPERLKGRLTLKADDTRRLALALARAGLDGGVADLLAGASRLEAEMLGEADADGVRSERLTARAASGLRLEASGELTARALGAKLAVDGLDLALMPPIEGLAQAVGARDLALDLALTRLKLRSGPTGNASLDLRREGANWRLGRLAVDGFGGVSVTGSGALLPEGGEIAGQVRSPRFEPLAALAAPLLPEALRQVLARGGDGLARFDAGFRLTRARSGETGLTLSGGAQAGRASLAAGLDREGNWRSADLTLDLTDRRLAFAALALPVPARAGAARLALRLAGGRLDASLAGSGLAIALDGLGGAEARLQVQAETPGQLLPEGNARLLPDAVIDASGRVAVAEGAVTLEDLTVHLGGETARGRLVLPREGPATGSLSLGRLDARALMAAALGSPPAPAATNWGTGRFATTAEPAPFRIEVSAEALRLAETLVLQPARFTIEAGSEGLSVESLSGRQGQGEVGGAFRLRREGGLAQLAGRFGLSALDLAALSGGGLAGTVSGEVEFGGSGESPARLIAGLGGAGQMRFARFAIPRFDPAAYENVIAATGEDASESETARLQDRFARAFDRGAWMLGDIAFPFTLAGGIARLQPLAFERGGIRAEASGLVDLRALSADLRLALRPLGALPKGWPGSAPQLGVAWRGPLGALKREADVGGVANMVAARALAREIERVEAFEADARERAIHTRRLRAERETRENERRLGEFLKAEEERRIAEEKRAEEARKAEEKRQEELRRAEERRQEELRRVEEARRLAEEARRQAEERARAQAQRRAEAARAEAEARARAEEERAARAAEERMRAAIQRQIQGEGGPLQPLPPPIQIETAPRPFSAPPQPN